MAYEKKTFEEYKVGEIIELRGRGYEVAKKEVELEYGCVTKNLYLKALDSSRVNGNRIAIIKGNGVIKFKKSISWSSRSSGTYYDSW